jgi:hypothetical protein
MSAALATADNSLPAQSFHLAGPMGVSTPLCDFIKQQPAVRQQPAVLAAAGLLHCRGAG